MKTLVGVAVIVGTLSMVALCAGILFVGCGGLKPGPDPSIDMAMIDANAAKFVECGLIQKISTTTAEIYVSRSQWADLNIEQRQGVAVIMGYRAGVKSGTHTYAVNVLDYQTGKRLARWSKAAGYTSYE